MRELDVVALVTDVPEHGLVTDQQGTIVHDYFAPDETDPDHATPEAHEVEFIEETGYTIAVLTLQPHQLRLILSYQPQP